MEAFPAIAFWLSLAVVAYTFAGYALVIGLLARWFPRPVRQQPVTPPVSVVLVVFNEQRRIRSRIENILAADYPHLELVVVSDGSTDGTEAAVRQMAGPRVRLISVAERRGKAAGLNIGVAAARGELVVFGDARQEFAPDAIRNLVCNFADPQVGAASGALCIAPASSAVGTGVDAYWKLEKRLRADESAFDSSIGCTGAIYAIRRELFAPLPDDTILDDVVVPMRIAVQGRRVVFDESARAWDPQPLEPAGERLRKRRTLAGNFQMLFSHPEWLLPWRNRLWLQLISHKYLRLTAPAFLLAAFAGNAALAHEPMYGMLLAGQCAFYSLALAARYRPGLRLFALPAGFVFLNWMTVKALAHFMSGGELHRWERGRE